MPGGRTVAAGTFALELDGKDAGPIRSASGGDAYADVVVEPQARSFYAKKHVVNVKWTPLKVSVGIAMADPLKEWIEGSLTGGYVRKDGAILERDATGKVRSRRAFTDAVISSVTIPACDAASKEASSFAVEITPAAVTDEKASGKAGAAVKQKAWQAASFRLEIDGLPCDRVAKVDALTIRQTAAEPPAGGARRVRAGATVEFPDLAVTFAAADEAEWKEWFARFVLQGRSSDADEKNGTLTFLAANLKDALGRVRLYGLGIYRLAAEPASPGAVKRLVAGLYCERMELEIL
jgi:hypothetical protein